MEDFRFVEEDENKRKAIYKLANMRLKGYMSEHGTQGLYWFNTEERISLGQRDLLESATDVKVIV